MNDNKVWICVYRETIEEHNDDRNLTEVQVTREFAKRYFNDRFSTDSCNPYETFEEFYNEYTADDTLDFYTYAMKHNAIIAMENW